MHIRKLTRVAIWTVICCLIVCSSAKSEELQKSANPAVVSSAKKVIVDDSVDLPAHSQAQAIGIMRRVIEERRRIPAMRLTVELSCPVASGAMANYINVVRVYEVASNKSNKYNKAVVGWRSRQKTWMSQYLLGPDGTTWDRGEWAPSVEHVLPDSSFERRVETYFDPRQFGLQLCSVPSCSGKTLDDAMWWFTDANSINVELNEDESGEVVISVHRLPSQFVEVRLHRINEGFQLKTLVLRHADSPAQSMVKWSETSLQSLPDGSQLWFPMKIEYLQSSDASILFHEVATVKAVEFLQDIASDEFRLPDLEIAEGRRFLVNGMRASVWEARKLRNATTRDRLDHSGTRYLSRGRDDDAIREGAGTSATRWAIVANLIAAVAVFILLWARRLQSRIGGRRAG